MSILKVSPLPLLKNAVAAFTVCLLAATASVSGKEPESPVSIEVKNGTRKDVSLLKTYMKDLAKTFEQNWQAPPQTNAGEATVYFIIDTGGTLARVELQHSSGDKDFDLSALEAVRQVKQFQPLPKLEQTVLIVNANFLGKMLGNSAPLTGQNPSNKGPQPDQKRSVKSPMGEKNAPVEDLPRVLEKTPDPGPDESSASSPATSSSPASAPSGGNVPARAESPSPAAPQAQPEAQSKSPAKSPSGSPAESPAKSRRTGDPGVPAPGAFPVFNPTRSPESP